MNKNRTLIFAFIIIAGLLGWIKFSPPSLIKQGLLKKLPAPIVLIENRPIWSNQLLKRLEDHQLVYGKNPIPNSIEAKKAILERLIFEKKLEILARKQGAEFLQWKNFSGSVLKNNAGNALLYKAAEVLGREDAFKFWFYSQKQLNPESYKLADFLIEEINLGKDFDQLAKTYSQDSSSLGLGGDLGPLKPADFIFELKEPLLQAKTGQALVLPSRFGLHVMWVYLKKVSQSGEDVIYLKQIYLKAADFGEWIKNETKDYRIINVIKL